MKRFINFFISYFIALSLTYTPFFAMASTSPSPGGDWKIQTIERLTLDKIADNTASKTLTDVIEATARKEAADGAKALNAVVRETVNRQAAGRVMMQRLMSGGVAIVGVAAVTALVGSLGWIMEQGEYVKYKVPDQTKICPDADACQWLWATETNSFNFKSPSAACTFRDQRMNATSSLYKNATSIAIKNNYTYSIQVGLNTVSGISGYTCTGTIIKISTGVTETWEHLVRPHAINPDYIPDQPQKEKIVLTSDLLGDMMVGDYTDPVDSNYDKKDDVWTGVGDSYREDPSGIGNEQNDNLKRKFNAAPETDKKPNDPPIPDGTGQKYPDPGTDPTDPTTTPGTDPTTDPTTTPGTDPTTDPTTTPGTDPTGTPSTDPKTDPTTDPSTDPKGGGSGWPAFCDWASTMCKWYEDWKDHRKNTESFWEAVKEFFGWVKDDSDLPDKDDSDLDADQDLEEKTYNINWGAQCPEPKYETVTLHGVTSQVKVQDFSYICSLDWLIKPYVIGFASITALFIIFGFHRSGDE